MEGVSLWDPTVCWCARISDSRATSAVNWPGKGGGRGGW